MSMLFLTFIAAQYAIIQTVFAFIDNKHHNLTDFIMRRLTSACIAVAISLFMAPPAHAAQEEDFDPNHPERMTVTPDVTVRNYVNENKQGIYSTFIFTKDSTVWVSNIFPKLYWMQPYYNPYKTYWVKGIVNHEKTTILIPAQSLIGECLSIQYTEKRPFENFYIYPMIKSNKNGETQWDIDLDTSNIVLKISSEGVITFDNTNDLHGIGYVTQYGYVGGNNEPDVITCLSLKPSQLQTILPPSGLPIEDYQMTYMAPAIPEDIYHYHYSGRIGRRIRAVRDGNDLYLQGCSYADPSGWILVRIGEKSGAIEAGEFSSMTTQSTTKSYSAGNINRVFQVALSSKSLTPPDDYHHNNYKYEYSYTPEDRNFLFDYNPESGCLSAMRDDATFMFTKDEDDSYVFEYETEFGWWPEIGKQDIYRQPAISKVPKEPQIPRPPMLKKDGSSWIITGSYYDTRDNVMKLENLYFRVYIDGKPFSFYHDVISTLWIEEPITELPFALLNPYETSPDDINFFNFYLDDIPDGAEVTAELVYYQDGAEHTSSGVGSVTDDSTPGDAVAPVYDLAGRKVSPDNLRPGIYIRGNKKIIVR